jgi:hypothetical protein
MRAAAARRLVLALWIALVTCAPALGDEASTAKRFEEARRDEPSLVAFLRAMPKGGDLHHHFPAGIFAETALGAAIRRGLFFDPATSRFEAEAAPGRVPASRLLTDDGLRAQFLNAASLRGPVSGVAGGHDKFFQVFGVLSSALPDLDLAQPLVEIVRRARLQNMQYLELLANPGGAALERVRAATLATETPEELVRRLKPQLDGYVLAAKADLDRWEHEVADKAGIDPPVEVRYQITAFRTDTDARILATLVAGLTLTKADPRVVGINLSGPEDHPIAQEGFERHMRILDALWRQFDRPNIALHAGELNLAISPVEPMTTRIRRSIDLGHARRIGHGVSVAWENDVAGLLRTMRAEGIAVEVCPTSNTFILGVEGDRHPFRLYQRAGVALTINTDDEGVNRSNLTMEYVRAVRGWGLSYGEVKDLVRNSLEYSFLAGASLFEGHDYRRVRPDYQALRERGWVPTPDEARRLATSDKAMVQARLERALEEFER